MEELLAKICKNTEPKGSCQIVVSSNKTRFNTRFNPPMKLDKNKKYEMALVNLETYYTFPNIDALNNYFRVGPTVGLPRHRHFVGFFNVPVLAPTRDHPFYTVIPTHRPI